MDVAIASVVTIGALFVGYRSIRKKFKYNVNCWFCCKDNKVKYNEQNSFVCVHCQQYNGFNKSGGYNKNIPGQASFVSKAPKFCARTRSNPHGPPGNGLCDRCNAQQAKLMQMINQFEPIDEKRWEEELEEYKYKLNKVYALCQLCSVYTHRKLQEDKRLYSYLLKLKDNFLPKVMSACKTAANYASRLTHRNRRQFFAGGSKTETGHWTSLCITLLLFVAYLNFLQEDAEVSFLQIPDHAQFFLPKVINMAFGLVCVALVSHLVAFMCNKQRPTLPDLLFPIVTVLLMASYLVDEEKYHEDLALWRCALSSSMAILSFAVTLVPRKRLHRKRPNRILHSAFSVASTPNSQCSSVADSFLLDSDDEQRDPKSHHKQPLLKENMHWRERQQSPEPLLINRRKREDSPERMEWESSSQFSTTSRVPPPSFASSRLASRLNGGREATPSRELAPSLSSLSIAQPNRTPSVFSLGKASTVRSNGFPAFSSDIFTGNNLRTPTVVSNPHRRSPTLSNITSVSRMRNRRISESPPGATPSVFTSVSQQQVSMSWGWKFAVGVLVISSLLGNVALFYLVFHKKPVEL